MTGRTVLRADRWVDVVAGEVRSPAVVVVEGNRIVSVDSDPGSRAGQSGGVGGQAAFHATQRAARQSHRSGNFV